MAREGERAGAGNRPGRQLTLLATRVHGADRIAGRSAPLATAMREQHDRVVGGLLGLFGGSEVERGERGLLVAFATPGAAGAGACAVQRRVAQLAWPGGVPLRLRVGIAHGAGGGQDQVQREATARQALRFCAAAHGGQILVGETAAAWLAERTPPGLTLLDLGEHDLAGGCLERVHQLTGLGLVRRFPPLRVVASTDEAWTSSAIRPGADEAAPRHRSAGAHAAGSAVGVTC